MTEKEYNKLKEELLKAPDTQISKLFLDKLKNINYGDIEELKKWIEEASISGEVSSFAINSVGFGLYNPQWEQSKI